MRAHRFLSRALAATLVASGLSVVSYATVAPSANAVSGACKKAQAGKVRYLYSSGKKTFRITEQKRVEISKGSDFSSEVSWTQTESHTNSVKLSSEVSVSVKAGIFGGAEAKVGGEYGKENTTSVQREERQTWHLSAPGNWYIARGFQTFKIGVTLQRCRRPNIGAEPNEYAWMTYSSGTVKGFSTVEGSIKCNLKPGTGTFRYFVKKQYC